MPRTATIGSLPEALRTMKAIRAEGIEPPPAGEARRPSESLSAPGRRGP